MMKRIKMKKYKIIEIRGYADELFRKGKIQVPFITNLQRFLDNFEEYQKQKEVKNERNNIKKD